MTLSSSSFFSAALATLDSHIATAKERVDKMDSLDGSKDRYLGTILSTLKAGLLYP